LLDNCPAHPPAETLKTRDGLIKVAYLPKNTTSLIQPLDQGIIATFKKNYRRELVSNIVSSEMPVTDFLKGMTIKDFIYTGATAWNAIARSTIEGCWMRGLSYAFSNSEVNEVDGASNAGNESSHSDVESENDFEGFSADEVAEVNTQQLGRFRDALAADGIVISSQDVDVWLQCDESAHTSEFPTDDEIVQSVISFKPSKFLLCFLFYVLSYAYLSYHMPI